jgi:hypothetical protein
MSTVAQRTGVAFTFSMIAAATSKPAASAPTDYPSHLRIFSTNEVSRMDVRCAPPVLRDGKQRTACSFSQFLLHKPKSQREADDAVAAVVTMLRAEMLKKDFWASFETTIDKADAGDKGWTSSDDVQGRDELRSAVKAKDSSALEKAISNITRKGAVETCSVSMNTFSYELTQLNEDTWEVQWSSGLDCSTVSNHLTIWRDHGDPWYLGNVRQVRVAPPNVPGSCGIKPGTTTSDFRRKTISDQLVQCQRIDLSQGL